MPRIIPLAEVNQMEPNEPIICVQGRLTTIYKQKSGETDKGPWSIQNGTLERDGVKIDLFIKDREEIPQSWKGRDIVITAHNGDRGWTGCYAMDDDYKGKVTRKIKVTSTAEVAILEGEAPRQQPTQQTQQPTQPPQQQHEPPPARTQQPPTQTAPPAPKSNIAAVSETLTQIANLQLLCLNLVADYVAPRYKLKTGIDLPAGDQHAWAMNLCIQGERIGLHNQMPVARATSTPKAPPAQQPAAPPPRPAGFPEDAQWDAGTGQWIDTDGNILF